MGFLLYITVVFATFHNTGSKDAGTLKFRTVEPPPERIGEIVELLLDKFAKEEAIFKAAGVMANEESAAEYKEGMTQILKSGSHHTVICCLDNNNDDIGEIIGASFMTLAKKNFPSDLKLEPTTKELTKMFTMIFAIADMYCISDLQKLDQYYDGRGVVVHTKYRGYGIAQEFLRVRRLICKEQGVPLTCALMTAYGTQKAAERDGWETYFEMNLADFGKQHGVSFVGCPPTVKLMGARIL